jgi:hypothetical protein
MTAKTLEPIPVLRGHLGDIVATLEAARALSAGRDLMNDGAQMATMSSRSLLTVGIEQAIDRLNAYLEEKNVPEGQPVDANGAANED